MIKERSDPRINLFLHLIYTDVKFHLRKSSKIQSCVFSSYLQLLPCFSKEFRSGAASVKLFLVDKVLNLSSQTLTGVTKTGTGLGNEH